MYKQKEGKRVKKGTDTARHLHMFATWLRKIKRAVYVQASRVYPTPCVNYFIHSVSQSDVVRVRDTRLTETALKKLDGKKRPVLAEVSCTCLEGTAVV